MSNCTRPWSWHWSHSVGARSYFLVQEPGGTAFLLCFDCPIRLSSLPGCPDAGQLCAGETPPRLLGPIGTDSRGREAVCKAGAEHALEGDGGRSDQCFGGPWLSGSAARRGFGVGSSQNFLSIFEINLNWILNRRRGLEVGWGVRERGRGGQRGLVVHFLLWLHLKVCFLPKF